MSTERKTRLFGIALLVLGLWPAVQIGLVARYDVSPWQLAAWGMYASPCQVLMKHPKSLAQKSTYQLLDLEH